MRFMTWNCRVGGFRYKAEHVAKYRPDVLAVQEVEPIETVLLFHGECQPTCRDRVADPAYPRRAIAMFSYTDTELRPVDAQCRLYGFRRYEARQGDLRFHVIGVWTAATESRQTAYMQAHEGLRLHADWIRERPTVMLGDFNNNASYRSVNWPQLLDLTKSLGLVSAYHTYFAEPFGSESRPTYFHGGRDTAPFHLDYCFVPDAWAGHITRVDVGTYQDWHTASDHSPLIVDLEVP